MWKKLEFLFLPQSSPNTGAVVPVCVCLTYSHICLWNSSWVWCLLVWWGILSVFICTASQHRCPTPISVMASLCLSDQIVLLDCWEELFCHPSHRWSPGSVMSSREHLEGEEMSYSVCNFFSRCCDNISDVNILQGGKIWTHSFWDCSLQSLALLHLASEAASCPQEDEKKIQKEM